MGLFYYIRLASGGLRTGTCILPSAAIELGVTKPRRAALKLDDNLKALLRELGHAINDSVAESDKIAEAIANVRAAGYDIVLKLDATIGLAQRQASDAKMTTQDRRFLESLHIRVDEEVLDEQVSQAKFEITPQDIKFLKSLKISIDNEA